MLEQSDLVLKNGELFFVGPTVSDWGGGDAGGLYLRDTRFLNYATLRVNGKTMDTLDVQVPEPSTATVVQTNPLLQLAEGDVVQARSIALEQHLSLENGLWIRYVLRNFSGRTLSLSCVLELAADFRDLFDIRGKPYPRVGEYRTTAPGEQRVTLGYVDSNGHSVSTHIGFDQPAEPAHRRVGQFEERSVDHAQASATARFTVTLAANCTWELNVKVEPSLADQAIARPNPRDLQKEELLFSSTETANSVINNCLERSRKDLITLTTCFPDGCLPAAGIPWYVAPFGRDSLIVGLQTLHMAPTLAASTLRTLAGLQGAKIDVWRNESPGKIPHEMRYGEMARLGHIPHSPFFGSLDATPLFVLLFAESVSWTDDDLLFDELLPNILRALDWIETYGDVDGDGLVEYRLTDLDEPHFMLPHPVWKDSVDSLHHIDGTAPKHGYIRPVEVQGYVYAAYARLAAVVAAKGHATWAATLQQRALKTQRAVESTFWLDEENYYAQALDDSMEPVRAISSNAGHLLFCGLPSAERAAAMTRRLQEPDLNSMWGVRTLSSNMPNYNPISYHNGSIWPHDNSLIVAGLHRYGYREEANRIGRALFNAAAADPLYRLPELYCGFSGDSDIAQGAPVPYPVSCSPQAWACGSLHLVIRSMLGLNIDTHEHRVIVDAALPEWLDQVKIREMKALGSTHSISVSRTEGDNVKIARVRSKA